MTIIGIDPGLTGGIAILSDARPWVRPMPVLPSPKGKGRNCLDENLIDNIIRDEKMDVGARVSVWIEEQQPHHRDGSKQAFATGDGFGLLRGLCLGLSIPFNVVPARTWQKIMLNGVSKGDTKAASIVQAGRLFPGVSLRPTEKSKPSHGMSDALLIAEYGRRQG